MSEITTPQREKGKRRTRDQIQEDLLAQLKKLQEKDMQAASLVSAKTVSCIYALQETAKRAKLGALVMACDKAAEAIKLAAPKV